MKRIIHIMGIIVPYGLIVLCLLAMIIHANRDYILNRFFTEHLVAVKDETEKPKKVETSSTSRVEYTDDGKKNVYVEIAQGLTVSDAVSGNVVKVSKFEKLTGLLGLLYKIFSFFPQNKNLSDSG